MLSKIDFPPVKKTVLALFWTLVIINLFLSARYVLHNDIVFSADIARDFHFIAFDLRHGFPLFQATRQFFLVIFAFNFYTAIKDTREAKNFIGKNPDSWKFLFNLSKKVYQQPEKTFGYFVFSPDAFGYQPRYAMIYTASLFNKQVLSFEKRPITYIIAAPHPFMKDRWWKENQVNIIGEPELTIPFENGYKIEKYLLSDEQIKIPFDPAINPGIHFR